MPLPPLPLMKDFAASLRESARRVLALRIINTQERMINDTTAPDSLWQQWLDDLDALDALGKEETEKIN